MCRFYDVISIRNITVDQILQTLGRLYFFWFYYYLLIFGDIIHQLEQELRKILKNITNLYCEMTTFDNKIIIRCLANDNYDLKKTLNYIMKNIINDKLPKNWNL